MFVEQDNYISHYANKDRDNCQFVSLFKESCWLQFRIEKNNNRTEPVTQL